MIVFAIVFIFLFSLQRTESANILFVTTFPSVSHQSVFRPMWKELSLRGHKVTAITPFPLNDKTLTNLTEIDLGIVFAPLKEKMENQNGKLLKYLMEKPGFLQVFIKDMIATYYFSKFHEHIISYSSVQSVIHSEQKFDVVIVEYLFPTATAFAAKFECPLIGVTSLGAPLVALDTLGNPTHPVYTPDHNLPVSRDLSLRERILSTLYSVYVRIHYHLVVLPREDRNIKKYFGENMPYIGDIERNISLLLLNRNPILHKIMPVVPAIVELGRVRTITTEKPLNSALKDFVEKSKNGVVYFSLGSNTRTSSLPEETIEIIKETFSKLPYDFVWKWEEDDFPGKPKNVFTQKWIPQLALLAHPKVKLFIMQGGLQSLEETINHKVPIIGIPFHSDQTTNVDTAVKYGFGINIDLEDITVERLSAAIVEIMTKSSYQENIEKAEKLMNDLPINGLEKAIWWIEYVIRHKGAKHLRSPSMDVPWYQYLLLDVIAVVTTILVLSVYIPFKIISLLLRYFNKKDKKKKE